MPEYFTLPELRALPQLGDDALYPDARCEVAAAWAVSTIEREVGTAFILRTVADEIHDGGGAVVLDQPFAQNTPALAVTEDGVAVTDNLLLRSGVLRKVSGGLPLPFSGGLGSVAVTYQYGYSAQPPGDIKEAALTATRWRLLATNSNAEMNARQTQVTNDMGGTTTFAVAGEDRPTGYPEVDAVIVAWRNKLNVFGFA